MSRPSSKNPLAPSTRSSSSSGGAKKRDQDVDSWLDSELKKAQSTAKPPSSTRQPSSEPPVRRPNPEAPSSSSRPPDSARARRSDVAPEGMDRGLRASSRGIPAQDVEADPRVRSSRSGSSRPEHQQQQEISAEEQQRILRRQQMLEQQRRASAEPQLSPEELQEQKRKEQERERRHAERERKAREMQAQMQEGPAGQMSARRSSSSSRQDVDVVVLAPPTSRATRDHQQPPPRAPSSSSSDQQQQAQLPRRSSSITQSISPQTSDYPLSQSQKSPFIEIRESSSRSSSRPSSGYEDMRASSRGPMPTPITAPSPAPVPPRISSARGSNPALWSQQSPSPQQTQAPFATAKRQSPIVAPPPPPPPKKEEAEDENYDDDFETYEEDFEEFDPSELEEVAKPNVPPLPSSKRSAAATDDALSSQRRPHSTGKPYTEPYREMPERRFLQPKDAKEAKKRSQAAQLKMQRFKQLTALIELESVSYDIFELVPLTEYELFVRGSVSQRTCQVSAQCPAPDDRSEIEIQTEPVTSSNAAAQCPEDLGLSGRGVTSTSGTSGRATFDSITLSRFLRRSAPVVETLMQENAEYSILGSTRIDTKFESLSSGLTRLQDFAICADRPAIDSSFCSSAPYNIVIAHGPSVSPSGTSPPPPEPFSSCAGLACVWNINTPTKPAKVLVCEPALRSICFATDRTHLVFAGTVDGSIQLWDLRESDSSHLAVDLTGGRREIVRFPTYSTDWMGDQNHSSPIVRIAQVGYNMSSERQQSLGGAVQIVTLDESGDMCFWVAIELSSAPDASSDADFGLSLGGRVKLIKSGSLANVTSPEPSLRSRCFDLECSPEDSSLFLLGTDSGHIAEVSRFQGRKTTRQYRCKAPSSPSDLLNTHFKSIQTLLKKSSVALPTSHRSEGRTLELEFPDPATLTKAREIISQNVHAVNCYVKAGAGGSNALVLALAKSELNAACHVTRVNASQLLSKYFVSGSSDGSINVFEESRTEPLITFEGLTRGAIKNVQWSTTRPSVFFALDSLSKLMVFDLLSPQTAKRKPTFEVDLRQTRYSGEKPCDAINFSVSPLKGGLLVPILCVQYEGGFIEAHSLSPTLASPLEREYEDVLQLLSSATR